MRLNTLQLLRNIPSVFGKVFSNNRAISGSFKRDVMFVMTSCMVTGLHVIEVHTRRCKRTSTAVLLNVRHAGSGLM